MVSNSQSSFLRFFFSLCQTGEKCSLWYKIFIAAHLASLSEQVPIKQLYSPVYHYILFILCIFVFVLGSHLFPFWKVWFPWELMKETVCSFCIHSKWISATQDSESEIEALPYRKSATHICLRTLFRIRFSHATCLMRSSLFHAISRDLWLCSELLHSCQKVFTC